MGFAFASDYANPLPIFFTSSILGSIAFLAVSYAIGVSLNTVAGFSFIRITGYRTYWGENPSNAEKKMREAFLKHFGFEPDDTAWRFCYGTTVKGGYGSNTQLFLGLEVFCKAMFVCCLLNSCAFGLASYWHFGRVGVYVYLLLALSCLILAYLFIRGARNYSKAFVASIYEGFYSWHCDQHVVKEL